MVMLTVENELVRRAGNLRQPVLSKFGFSVVGLASWMDKVRKFFAVSFLKRSPESRSRRWQDTDDVRRRIMEH